MLLSIPRQIVLPDPISPASPISWERAVTRYLAEAPLIRRRLVRFAAASRYYEPSSDPEILLRQALRSLASKNLLATLVKGERGFREIVPFVWREPSSVADPAIISATGMLIVTRDLIPPACYGSDFFGAAIYIDQQQLEMVAQLRGPVTEHEVMEEARAIVQDVISGPLKRIRKAEFMRRLIAHGGGHVPIKIRDRVWRSKVVPAAWRARGRWT